MCIRDRRRIGLISLTVGNSYALDFRDYDMTSEQYANISNVQGFDSGDNSISASYSDGIAQFASCPSAVEYTYSIGSTLSLIHI